MNLISFILLVAACCYTVSGISDDKNGSPLMWLLMRQLERTDEDFKKLEGQVKKTDTTMESFGKELEGLRVDMENVKSEMNTLETYHNCETGWKKWNGYCYYFSKDILTWTESKKRCSSALSHLVKVENAEENKMLVSEVNRLGGSMYWIGANDISREGTWRWDADNTPLYYSYWQHGEPNNYGNQEDCANLNRDFHYKWNDYPCQAKRNFICKKWSFLRLSKGQQRAKQ